MKENHFFRKNSGIPAFSVHALVRASQVAVILAVFFMVSCRQEQNLVTYSVPEGTPGNNTYSVQVREPGGSWQDLFVYNVMVVAPPNNPDDTDEWYLPTSVVNFSFGGTIEMKVTLNEGTINSFEIRPASFGIQPVQDGNTLTFNVTQVDSFPRKFVLRVNDDWAEQCLHVMGNPLEVDPPSPEEVTHYFGPGLHTVGENSPLRDLKSGDKVYIAGGAILKGAGIYGKGISDVWVGGRGIMNITERYRPGSTVIHFEDCSDITIDGTVTFHQARGWCVRFVRSDNVTISNYSLFSDTLNSDGIHFDGCQNCVATSCFLRASDDLFLVNGTGNGSEDCIDNTYKNSVLWGDKAHIFVAGFDGNVDSFNVTKNIVFRNIDVINHKEGSPGFRGVIKIWCTKNQTVRDILYEDIRVMSFQDPSKARIIEIKMEKNYAYYHEGLAVRNIKIRNLSYTGSGEVESWIHGESEERYVDSVLFVNYTRNGELVTDTTSANMRVGPFAQNVMFKSE